MPAAISLVWLECIISPRVTAKKMSPAWAMIIGWTSPLACIASVTLAKARSHRVGWSPGDVLDPPQTRFHAGQVAEHAIQFVICLAKPLVDEFFQTRDLFVIHRTGSRTGRSGAFRPAKVAGLLNMPAVRSV